MLSIQIVNSARTIQVTCDNEGLTTVIKALEKILRLRWTCTSLFTLVRWS